MRTPVIIQFRGLDPSPALEALVGEKAHKLEHVRPGLMSCRVVIEQAHRHQRQGRPFLVRLDCTWPGHELTVSRLDDEDASVAARLAFDAMRRRIDESIARADVPLAPTHDARHIDEPD